MPNIFDDLSALISQKSMEIMASWRVRVRALASARHLEVPTLNDHIPALLEELASALQSQSDGAITNALIDGTPPEHGVQRVQDGFNITEVVAEYNILRGCIHDLADDNGLSLQGPAFHVINRVFDQAIGLAVDTFATAQALEVQRRREEYLVFVAHDLRTPLNAIALATKVIELTSTDLDPNGERHRMLNSLRRNVQHLEKLVAKVIDENSNLRTEIGIKVERRDLDLWPFVEALIHDLHPVAGTSSTRLVNSIPLDQVVYADAFLLSRVYQNLIANAIRYTPRGLITIGVREVDAGDAVECFITDTGAGIPEDLLSRVFGKGETDVASDDGLGLGLAIVKTFIEAHNGAVTVESIEGQGATFRFVLPHRTTRSI